MNWKTRRPGGPVNYTKFLCVWPELFILSILTATPCWRSRWVARVDLPIL